ncbi:MAG: TIGR04442 family protein [Desulfuromonadaceae bacterium]|nr:TIGR04442 family protein [Desulfuromonadaceae bacterium]MDD2848881.1 TIGR04442 family protein [Desulfuromonadaceae bacterium]MDD4132162.1 TIGR04442 family protein [Desulfuromonadaceae bacterium]
MAVPSISMPMTAVNETSRSGGVSPSLLEKARQALAAYFMFSASECVDMPENIILSILLAKKESIEQNDQRFEHVMLDIGKYCDERLDVSGETGKRARKNFLRMVGMIQRTEEASKCINKMVFFARGIPDEETLNVLANTWKELNAVKPGLFRELLLDTPLASDLLGRMGRKRLINLMEGFENLTRGAGTITDIQRRLERVEREEQILVTVVTTIQEAIGNSYGWIAGDGERDTIKRIVSIELRHRRLLNGDIPDNLFDVGLKLAKSSLLYMNTLLPIIVSQGDAGLREEFVRDSGLDRLLVEELEEFWCVRENIAHQRLVPIRGNV